MENITVLSKSRALFITLGHDITDPGAWVIRRSEKFLWFKKRISSDWFTSKEQAMTFANEMVRKHSNPDTAGITSEKV